MRFILVARPYISRYFITSLWNAAWVLPFLCIYSERVGECIHRFFIREVVHQVLQIWICMRNAYERKCSKVWNKWEKITFLNCWKKNPGLVKGAWKNSAFWCFGEIFRCTYRTIWSEVTKIVTSRLFLISHRKWSIRRSFGRAGKFEASHSFLDETVCAWRGNEMIENMHVVLSSIRNRWLAREEKTALHASGKISLVSFSFFFFYYPRSRPVQSFVYKPRSPPCLPHTLTNSSEGIRNIFMNMDTWNTLIPSSLLSPSPSLSFPQLFGFARIYIVRKVFQRARAPCVTLWAYRTWSPQIHVLGRARLSLQSKSLRAFDNI